VFLMAMPVLHRGGVTRESIFDLLGNIGAAALVSLTVSYVFEALFYKKLEDFTKHWNYQGAKAALSGLTGAPVPDELAAGIVEVISGGQLKRHQFSSSYRFTAKAGKLDCQITTSFVVTNRSSEAVTYPLRDEYHRGFLPDHGRTLKIHSVRAIDLRDNRVHYEKTNVPLSTTGLSLFHERQFRLKPSESLQFLIESSFSCGESFSYYESFNTAVEGIRINLDVDTDGYNIGYMDAVFWKKRLLEESKSARHCSFSYSGVVFPGQGIGFWIFPNHSSKLLPPL